MPAIALFFVVYSISGQCLYWYSTETPEKRNPCGLEEVYVPESAERIDSV